MKLKFPTNGKAMSGEFSFYHNCKAMNGEFRMCHEWWLRNFAHPYISPDRDWHSRFANGNFNLSQINNLHNCRFQPLQFGYEMFYKLIDHKYFFSTNGHESWNPEDCFRYLFCKRIYNMSILDSILRTLSTTPELILIKSIPHY